MRVASRLAVIGALFFALSACDNASPGDADAGLDGAEPNECLDVVDGTSCGTDRVCVGGVCVEHLCGNGTVDAGEECDDGNLDAFDGCEPDTCVFTCAEGGCADANACDGVEQCTAAHICEDGTPLPDTTACTTESGVSGQCSQAQCVPPGCGNSAPDAGEECDDGRNGDDADGCKDDCTFSCHANADCVDTDACNGAETCNLTTHACAAGTPVAEKRWFIDCDGDGFAVNELDSVLACVRPSTPPSGCGLAAAKWTDMRPLSAGTIDCNDSNGNVRPNQTTYFPTTTANDIVGASDSRDYDYNCDMTETRRFTTTNASTTASCGTPDLLGRCLVSACRPGEVCPPLVGWTGSGIPSCTPGASAQYTDCAGANCSRRIYTREQECR